MRKEEKIFAREEHFCPYSKNASCSGWGWGCGEDCPIHPDYEDEGYSCDYDEDEEYEDEIDKVLAECDSFREAYDLGFSIGEDSGYLEGYKSCLKGEACYIWDEELDELLEEVEEIKENSKYINKTIEDLEETEDYREDEDNNLPILVDTEIIDGLEKLKKDLIDLKWCKDQLTGQQVLKKILNMMHNITVIQETYVKEELQRYLGYK